MAKRLSRMLILNRIVDVATMERAFRLKDAKGGRLGTNLLELGVLDEETLQNCLATTRGLPTPPKDLLLHPQGAALSLLEVAEVEASGVMPVAFRDQVLEVLVKDPLTHHQKEEIRERFGKEPLEYQITDLRFEHLLSVHYGAALSERLQALVERFPIELEPKPTPEEVAQPEKAEPERLSKPPEVQPEKAEQLSEPAVAPHEPVDSQLSAAAVRQEQATEITADTGQERLGSGAARQEQAADIVAATGYEPVGYEPRAAIFTFEEEFELRELLDAATANESGPIVDESAAPRDPVLEFSASMEDEEGASFEVALALPDEMHEAFEALQVEEPTPAMREQPLERKWLGDLSVESMPIEEDVSLPVADEVVPDSLVLPGGAPTVQEWDIERLAQALDAAEERDDIVEGLLSFFCASLPRCCVLVLHKGEMRGFAQHGYATEEAIRQVKLDAGPLLDRTVRRGVSSVHGVPQDLGLLPFYRLVGLEHSPEVLVGLLMISKRPVMAILADNGEDPISRTFLPSFDQATSMAASALTRLLYEKKRSRETTQKRADSKLADAEQPSFVVEASPLESRPQESAGRSGYVSMAKVPAVEVDRSVESAEAFDQAYAGKVSPFDGRSAQSVELAEQAYPGEGSTLNGRPQDFTASAGQVFGSEVPPRFEEVVNSFEVPASQVRRRASTSNDRQQVGKDAEETNQQSRSKSRFGLGPEQRIRSSVRIKSLDEIDSEDDGPPTRPFLMMPSGELDQEDDGPPTRPFLMMPPRESEQAEDDLLEVGSLNDSLLSTLDQPAISASQADQVMLGEIEQFIWEQESHLTPHGVAAVGATPELHAEDSISEGSAAFSYSSSEAASEVSAFDFEPAGQEPEWDAGVLLDALLSSDETTSLRARAELLLADEEVLDVLQQAFPGPVYAEPGLPHSPKYAGKYGPLMAAVIDLGPRFVSRLATLMSSKAREQRLYATVCCPDLLHSQLFKPLLERLFDTDPVIRRVACEAIDVYRGHRQFNEVWTELRRALLEDNPNLQAAASEAIGMLFDDESIPYLIELLSSKSAKVQSSCLAALERMVFQSFGTDRKKWLKWYNKHGMQSREDWLIEGVASRESGVRFLVSEYIRKMPGINLEFDPTQGRREQKRVQLALKQLFYGG